MAYGAKITPNRSLNRMGSPKSKIQSREAPIKTSKNSAIKIKKNTTKMMKLL